VIFVADMGFGDGWEQGPDDFPAGSGVVDAPAGAKPGDKLQAAGLTTHGLRHGHKTWMAEDGIPEILSEQRLGHEVPGMRGLYAHASDRMRANLTTALQARWEESLQARGSITPNSPVPLLNELLNKMTPTATIHTLTARGDTASQIPPKKGAGPIRDVG
jgi:hypothetical protein